MNNHTITQSHINPLKKFTLKAKGDMPLFKSGKTKECILEKMHGRIYKDDRDKDGKFIDVVGIQDNRIMVYAGHVPGFYDEKKQYDLFHKVFKDLDEVNEYFEDIPATQPH